ncbi:uncharacterized protein [Ambystoma mexicanum]|uniref:uncharacterized protein isoform X1 n=1 Tax=Ambystoma mexicanum TaxID=8296 RepID=UPI0037E752A9
MEAVVKALAEGQQQLQQLLQVQSHQAQADRQALQQAIQVQSAAQEQGREALRILGEAVATTRTHPGIPPTVLQKYQVGEDPSFFFVNFERIARAAQWPQDRWAFYLAPLLTGVMQGAYQAANPTGDTPYTEIKKTVLERLGMDEESYRLKFRETRLKPGESPRQLFYRVQDLAEKWLQTGTATIGQIKDKVMMEQFIDALPGPIQRWVRQHHHLSLVEAIDVATAFQKAGSTQPFPATQLRPSVEAYQVRIGTYKGPGTEPRNKAEPRPTNGAGLSKGPAHQCFECGEWGHIARFCSKKPKTEPMEIGSLQAQEYRRKRLPYVIEVTVDGHPRQAMMDSGSRQTAIQPHVSEQDSEQLQVEPETREEWKGDCDWAY